MPTKRFTEYMTNVEKRVIWTSFTTRNSKHQRAAANLAANANTLSGPNLTCDSEPVVYTYRLNFIWISVLCHPFGAKNLQNIAILTKFSQFGGSCVDPLYQSRPNLARNSRPRSILTCQISFESVYCVTFTIENLQFWHLGGSCIQPLLLMTAKFNMLK